MSLFFSFTLIIPHFSSELETQSWAIYSPLHYTYIVYDRMQPRLCLTFCDSMDRGPTVHGFFRQIHWSGLPFPLSGDLPNPGIKHTSLVSQHWQVDSLPLLPPGEPIKSFWYIISMNYYTKISFVTSIEKVTSIFFFSLGNVCLPFGIFVELFFFPRKFI